MKQPAGHRIIKSVKQAIAGDFAAVTVDGQTWVRRDDLSKMLEALRELSQIVECADWTNSDMPSWEFEPQLEEAKRRARKALDRLQSSQEEKV